MAACGVVSQVFNSDLNPSMTPPNTWENPIKEDVTSSDELFALHC